MSAAHFINHNIKADTKKWDEPFRIVCAIDPGKERFALSIQKIFLPTSKSKTLPVVVVCKLGNFKQEIIKYPEVYNDHLYDRVTKFLDKELPMFNKAHIILIEKQLTNNPKMVRMAQFCIDYFMFKVANSPKTPLIIEVSAKVKTQYLGARKGLTRSALKTWTRRKIIEDILPKRKDDATLAILKKYTVKDGKTDLCDSLAMIEAASRYFCLSGKKINTVSSSETESSSSRGTTSTKGRGTTSKSTSSRGETSSGERGTTLTKGRGATSKSTSRSTSSKGATSTKGRGTTSRSTSRSTSES